MKIIGSNTESNVEQPAPRYVFYCESCNRNTHSTLDLTGALVCHVCGTPREMPEVT